VVPVQFEVHARFLGHVVLPGQRDPGSTRTAGRRSTPGGPLASLPIRPIGSGTPTAPGAAPRPLPPTNIISTARTDAPASAGVTARGVLAALPDFALAGAFLVTWIDPFALGATAVPYYLLTMLLEFVIVHSSAFMGNVLLSSEAPARRLRNVLGLGLFYTLFVGGFALGFGTWWPIWAFWGLTFNRMLSVILGDAPEGRERQYVRAGWALSVMYYLGGAFATTLLPVPEFGVTAAARGALDLPGGGLWVDEPQRVLAFGFLYFGMTGIGEVLGWARNEKFLKGVPKDPS
jgi:hypothetical protein